MKVSIEISDEAVRKFKELKIKPQEALSNFAECITDADKYSDLILHFEMQSVYGHTEGLYKELHNLGERKAELEHQISIVESDTRFIRTRLMGFEKSRERLEQEKIKAKDSRRIGELSGIIADAIKACNYDYDLIMSNFRDQITEMKSLNKYYNLQAMIDTLKKLGSQDYNPVKMHGS